jgi:hypothetical protein
MTLDFIVEAIENDLYVLGSEHDPEGCYPCVLPTVYLSPRLLPLGTKVCVTIDGLTEADLNRDTGRFWGYPECCIEHFEMREGPMSEDQKTAGQGTGFVPCPTCTRLVLAGKPLHELILSTRQAPKPFPTDRRHA